METFGNPSVQTSGGYYAGIGYEQTESVHFEDLKAKQEVLKMRALEVAKEYKTLAKLDKAAKKASVERSTKKKKENLFRDVRSGEKGTFSDAEIVPKVCCCRVQ